MVYSVRAISHAVIGVLIWPLSRLLSILEIVAALAIVLAIPLMMTLTLLGMLFFMLLSTSDLWIELYRNRKRKGAAVQTTDDLDRGLEAEINYAGKGICLLLQLLCAPFIAIAVGMAVTAVIIFGILTVAVPVPLMALWIVVEP